MAAADAWMRGVERRIKSRAQSERGIRGFGLHQPLGCCGGRQVPESLQTNSASQSPAYYAAYRNLLASPRWQRAFNLAHAAAAAVGQHRHERS